MARSQGSKSRTWADGGEYLGTQVDYSLNRTNKYAPKTYSSETILGSNHKGPPYRSGGPMLLTRVKTSHNSSPHYFGSASASIMKNGYEGKFAVSNVPNAIPLPTYNLSALGTEAVSRTLPTSPSASLSVFIGELRDVPHMLKQTKELFYSLARSGMKLHRGNVTVGEALDHFKDPAKPAGDYLNLQFGWIPFLRDLQSFYKTGKDLDKKVATLRRNNGGKVITRSRTLRSWDESTLAEASVWNGITPVLTPSVYTWLYQSGTACSTRTRTIKQKGKIWFKASYSYYSPEVANFPDWALKADILGLRLDPAVIYQLVPWSWLLDWFTTTGAAVTNAVEFAKHHIVMHHGYTMASMSSTHKTVCTQRMYTGYGAGSGSVTTTLTADATCLFETKQRVAANPFGFGINWESLSGYQLSILTAIGITRGKLDG